MAAAFGSGASSTAARWAAAQRRGLVAAAVAPRRAPPASRAAPQLRASSSSSASAAPPPSWEIRMLYDGDCPLCMKEVDFLRRRDAGKGRIDFVDIADPAYSADANYGISYEQAMEKIHAIEADGRIITGIEVFRRLYEAVGLGWVYALTKNPSVERAANSVYDMWAKYRTQLTGREALEAILQRRAAEAAGKGDAGSLCGPDAEAACELPKAEAAARREA